jgi:hypothetical protein
MSTTTISTAVCVCGKAAVYREPSHRNRPLGNRMELCEECAKWNVAERHGERILALDAIGAAVGLARQADLSEDEIRQGFEESLTRPETHFEVPSSYRPLGGASNTDVRYDPLQPLADAGEAA